MAENTPKLIALYLPQFHPTENNNRWWGEGFTEWTNVRKAKPLFPGHRQPIIPGELGYYSLLDNDTRLRQAELARRGGIDAFCYYHYWFGAGREELQTPFNLMLQSGQPDFPFCLCWANESWHKKFWSDFDSVEKQLLAEQTYPGADDIKAHFERLSTAFSDKRYYKIAGRNVFMIYKPLEHPHIKLFIDTWRKMASKAGLPDFFFIGQIQNQLTDKTVDHIISLGFDAVNSVGLYAAAERAVLAMHPLQKLIFRTGRCIGHKIFRHPEILRYATAAPHFISNIDSRPDCIPTIIPNWDHTPRSGRNGYVLHKSNPTAFGRHVTDVLSLVAGKELPIAFIKSWNEWGEGNYLEPDARFGTAYLDTLKACKETSSR